MANILKPTATTVAHKAYFHFISTHQVVVNEQTLLQQRYFSVHSFSMIGTNAVF